VSTRQLGSASADGDSRGETTGWIPTRTNAVKISLWYGILSALWILSSGWVLHRLAHDSDWEPLLENIKGWFFVLFTAFLLGMTLDRHFRQIRRSAVKLKESEQNYREIFNATNDAILLHDAETGQVLDVNEAVLRMHGNASKAELLQGRGDQFFIKDSRYNWEEAQRRIRLAVQQGPQVFEWINHRKNGEPFWVEVSLRSTQVGGEDRVLAVVREISERKRAEEELKQTRNTLVEAQKIAHLGSFEYVAATRTTVWSEEEYRIYGLDPAQPSPGYDEMLVRCIHPEDRLLLHERFTQAMESQSIFELEHRIVQPDGSVRWVCDRAHPFFGEQGEIVRYVGTTLDITERRRAEEALRVSEERLALATAGAALGVWDWDIVKDETYLSGIYYEIAGFPESEKRPGLEFFRSLVHPEDWSAVTATLEEHLRGKTEYSVIEYRIRQKSGELRWIRGSGKVVNRDEHGAPLRMVGVVMDITERKTQEIEIKRLTRLYATLSQVNQSITRCHSREELFDEMCRVLVEFGKFRAAWMGERDGRTGVLKTSASRSTERDPNRSLGLGQCGVIAESVESGCPVYCNFAQTDPRAACCRESLLVQGIRSCASFPLQMQGQRIGAFSVCAEEPEFFRAEEASLLEKVAADISYALERLEEQEQRQKAQAALHEANARLQKILEVETVGVMFWEMPSGVLVDANDAFLNLMGYSREEVAARAITWQKLNSPEFMEVSQAEIQKFEATGRVGPYEKEYLRKDGVRQWLMLAGSALDAGTIVEFCVDISALKKAEAALRKSEERHRALSENLRDAILTVDPGKLKFTSGNPAALKMFQIGTEAELLGYGPKDFAPEFQPDGRLSTEWISEHEGALPVEGTRCFEWKHRRLDGSEFFADVMLARIEWGDQSAVMATIRDVTEHRNAELEIQRQSSLIQSLLDSIPDLVFYKDLEGVYLGCNPAFAEFIGRSREEIIGKSDYELFPKQAAEFFRSQDLEMLGSLTPRQNEEWVVRHDGTRVLLDTLKTPYRSTDGSLLGVLGISRDLTVRRAAEEKLRQSERRFHELVEAAPEAMFVRTGDHFAYVNTAALRLFGASSVNQLQGQPVLDRFQGEWRETVAARMDKLDKNGEKTLKVERSLLRLDGSTVEVSLSAVPISFEGQQSALVVARDISDRKRAIAAMLRQFELQNRLTKTAATVPGTLYSWRLKPDGSMAMSYASAALESTFGIKPEQIRDDATPLLALIHPEDARRVQESIIQSARTLKPWRGEFRARGTPRGEIWIEGHSVPQLEPDGSILWHGFLQDITERRHVEDQLRKLSRAVEQSPTSIVITDAEGTIEYVNPKFTELTGYTVEEARGKNPRILKSGATPQDEYRQLWDTIKRGETWRGELHNRKKNGEKFWEFATISPVTNDAGKITHFLAVKEDITERKELEAQFRQSQKLEGIGQLAGGVAHDFNNILAAMMMQAELASMAEGVPNEVREGLREIRTASERAANLTRQLLLFSRKQILQPRDLDLNDVVTNLAKMLQRIIREDVRLQIHLHPAPLITHADAGMLDQVLMNLAVNARDAMPNGGHVLIETTEKTFDATAPRIHPDAAPGRYVSLVVTDTGTGMTPEVMSRIFEPFFTTKEPGKGTGLGLATVFGIVKQHRGWVSVESEPAKGARFQVYFPASESRAVTRTNTARSTFHKGTETILLVEDDDPIRRMTRRLLERQGYTVIEAPNGVEALALWKQHRDRIALLLTDLVMPAGMTGQQLARALQRDKPNLKIVFTSGYSTEIAGGEIHLRNGENFLQKPSSPAILLETLRKTLDA
jgi:PAS domain S-box-containing protein